MQKRLLELLHKSHRGIKLTLCRARHTVFWLNLTTDIKNKIKNCSLCQPYTPKQQKETLQSHAVPKDPWTKVGADPFELKDTHYIVIVDYTTDYMEFQRLTNQTTQPVLSTLKYRFSHLGIPNTVTTDNGLLFTSHQFTTFSKD